MTSLDTVRIMHLSDMHLACLDKISWRSLLNKRILGYIRWHTGRSREYEYRILPLIRQEIQRLRPDQVVLTGDLTHLGLAIEFQHVAGWLDSIAPADSITIVPGNHDVYVPAPWEENFSFWGNYILPYSSYTGEIPPASIDALFPTLHIRKNVAIIGISTAQSCGWHLATGRIGHEQLERIETALKAAKARRLFRIIALHHPPVPGKVGRRKRLIDITGLSRIIAHSGCELVLHGHSHNASIYSINGPGYKIPAIEAPSALSISRRKKHRARFFICEIKKEDPNEWKCKVITHGFESLTEGFVTRDIREFTLPC